MRSGRLIQSGTLSDVWQHPADADTARFLGYASVLSGPEALSLTDAASLPPADVVALRRSALSVSPDGPLAGTVVAAALSPEQIRLTIEVDGLGVLDAVSRTDVPTPVPGQRVRLDVDVTRLALVGAPGNPLDPR
jgi:thiamine transport system ATP-binding protein